MIRWWIFRWLGLDYFERSLERVEVKTNALEVETKTLGKEIEQWGLLNLGWRLRAMENSFRKLEERLEAIEKLSQGADGYTAHKTADLLEAAAALRRDKSAAEARGYPDVESYREARAKRPPPPKPPEL
jgi:hypothetical protein